MQAPCGGIFELSPDRITITGATVYRLPSLAYGMPALPRATHVLVSRAVIDDAEVASVLRR